MLEKHRLAASRTLPNWNPACNPGMCPSWDLNQRSLDLQASSQSNELHQPGLDVIFKTLLCTVFLVIKYTYIHTVVQPSPSSISRAFSSSQTKILYPLNNCFRSSLPLPPVNYHSAFYLNLTSLGTLYKWNHTVYVF